MRWLASAHIRVQPADRVLRPAYNLSDYLGVYKNDRQVALLMGDNGPGDQDVWMSGYLDDCDDISYGWRPRRAYNGRISYLSAHPYRTNVPITSGSQSQRTRFEADCITGGGVGCAAGGRGHTAALASCIVFALVRRRRR